MCFWFKIALIRFARYSLNPFICAGTIRVEGSRVGTKAAAPIQAGRSSQDPGLVVERERNGQSERYWETHLTRRGCGG